MSIRTPALLLAALTFAAAPSAAQENPHASHATTGAADAAKPTGEHAEHDMAAMHAKMHPAGADAIKPLYDSFKGWIVAAAEQLPEADYAYAPTSGVRTFGQLFGHIANANYMFCSQGGAGANPSKADVEKTMTSKADLVAALKAAFAFCDAAYVLPDAQLTGEVEIFGMKGSKLWVLNFNAVHNAEHYGNLVTYLRMKGMVPPSSQQS